MILEKILAANTVLTGSITALQLNANGTIISSNVDGATNRFPSASPHPNGSVKTSHFDLNINWDGLSGDNKGIYRLFRGWLAKGLEGRTCS